MLSNSGLSGPVVIYIDYYRKGVIFYVAFVLTGLPRFPVSPLAPLGPGGPAGPVGPLAPLSPCFPGGPVIYNRRNETSKITPVIGMKPTKQCYRRNKTKATHLIGKIKHTHKNI